MYTNYLFDKSKTSGKINFPVRDIIISLKRNGISFREIARHIGVSHTTIRFWALGICKPRNPNDVLKTLSKLIVEEGIELVDDYYSNSHNGPPNHLFELKPGEAPPIQRFKRMIKKIADILDTYNRQWIEEATKIGLDYLIKSRDRVTTRKLPSFVVACYRVAALRIYYIYPDWDDKIKFLTAINMIKNEDYEKYVEKLSKYLAYTNNH